MSNSRKIIGRTIFNVRTEKELTQQELADKLDSDRHYICKLEKGKVNITADYLDKIITILESNHAEFFNRKHII